MKNVLSISILLAFTLMCAPSYAERYGGEFLNIPVGAKALSMGAAFGPVSDDATAIYWNPGGLGHIRIPTVMFVHTALYANLANHDFMALVWPMSRRFTLGIGWIRFGVDDIPRFSYTVGTPPTGIFGDNENAIFLSSGMSSVKTIFGKPVEIDPGTSIKFIYSKLDDREATGLGLDLGAIIKVNLAEWFVRRSESRPLLGMLPAAVDNSNFGTLSLSFAGQDLGGTSMAWNTVKQHNDVRLATYKIGLSYQQPMNLLRSAFTFVWEGSTDEYQKGRFGLEIKYRKALAFRAGKANGEFTFGSGISLWRFDIDYAYSGHDLGNTHRVSASYGIR